MTSEQHIKRMVLQLIKDGIMVYSKSDVRSMSKSLDYSEITESELTETGVRKKPRKFARQQARNAINNSKRSGTKNETATQLSRKERRALAKATGDRFQPMVNKQLSVYNALYRDESMLPL